MKRLRSNLDHQLTTHAVGGGAGKGLAHLVELVDLLDRHADLAVGDQLRGGGGTGSFAAQLLKLWGARVAATCSARNAGFMAELGADVVINYTSQDFARILRDVDLALRASFPPAAISLRPL
jgi:hypothetical protein